MVAERASHQPPADWLTIDEAARRHRVGTETARKWAARGQVRAVKVLRPQGQGGAHFVWRVCPADAQEAAAAYHRAHPPAAPAGEPAARPPARWRRHGRDLFLRRPLLLAPDSIPHCPKRAMLLARVVAAAYEMTLEAMLAKTREPLPVEARTVLLALLSEMPALYAAHGFAAERGWGSTALGDLVGKDHATVIHLLRGLTERPTPEHRAMLRTCRQAAHRELAAKRERIDAKTGGDRDGTG